MKKLALSVFIILCTITIGIAQVYPVKVTALVNPPAPVSFHNYADASTLNSPLRVQLLLSDISISNRQIRLKVSFEGNGIAFESNDMVVGASPLYIDGGVPLTLTNIELAPYYEYQNIQGINANTYGHTIPEGSYQFCFEIFDYITGNRLSSKTCATTYIFKNDPPLLNLPLNKVNIEPTGVENIVFQWTPRHINVSNVEYVLSIVEIWDDLVDPQTAFLTAPPFFETTTRATSFVYGPSQPLLLPNKRYAWQVQAKAKQGAEEIGLFRNQGKSEIFWFSRTSPCTTPFNVYAEPKGISKINVFWDEDSSIYQEYTIAYREANKPNAYWFTMRTNSGWATVWDLKPGTTYEYKVKGKCKYLYGTYSEVQEVSTATAQDETANYNCGIVPDAIAITNRNPHPGLQIGSRITAGDFVVTIVEIEKQDNGRITGRGYVGIPYLKFTRFGVKFDNILVNTDSQLAEGEMVTLYDPTFGENESMTVDLNTDVVETINGDAGESSQVTVAFIIKSITINEHGAIVITGTNGEEALIPGGKDVSIVDSDGKVWTVDEQGNAQNYGEIAEGGPANEENTDGIEEDKITQISATGVLVTFKKSGYFYYDNMPQGTEDKLGSLYTTVPIVGGGTYTLPYKAISGLKTDDILIAEADFKDTTITTDDIVFKTEDGIKIPAKWNGNTATLTLKKSFDYAIKQVLATVKPKEEKDKYTIAGAFNLVHLGSKEFKDINVVLIPVNGAEVTEELKTKINQIYNKAGVNFNLSVENQLQIPESVWDIDQQDNQLNAGDSGMLAHYSKEEIAINKYFKANGAYKEDAYYVFVTDIKAVNSVTSKSVAGFMPLKRQFGFVFESSTNDAVTIAHELGHGIFGLSHPSSEYGVDENATQFIMNYGTQEIFNHIDWKNIHAAGFKIYLFQDDKEGESVTIGSFFRDTKVLNDIGAETYTFITPSAELIVLPDNVEDVEFYYGYYGTSKQGEFKQFLNFTPGTLKSFKIEGEVYEASIQFLDDDSANLLGYFTKDDNPTKFNNKKYIIESWRNTTPTIMTHNGKGFVLARLWGSYKVSLPTYNSNTSSKLKNVLKFPAPESGGNVFYQKLQNYSKFGSKEYIVTNEIAKWVGSLHENADRPDIFIRNKIAELKAAFPVFIDYVTSDSFDKWELCNSEYPKAASYKFIQYLSNKYCNCEDKSTTSNYSFSIKYECSPKSDITNKPENKIDFLREYVSFLDQKIGEETKVTDGIIKKIKADVNFVDTVDINELVRALNFATEKDINGFASEDIIRIMARMASENLFESYNPLKDRENAVTKLIENIDHKHAGEIISGLEGKNYYEKGEYIYRQFFKNVDDTFLGFVGENNRERLIRSFVTLSLKAAEDRNERLMSLINDFENRSFVLEYQNILKRTFTQAELGNPMLRIASEFYSDGNPTYFSIDTDYDSKNGTFKGKQNRTIGFMPDFMNDFKGEFTSKSLKPFDLVYFLNNTKLDGISKFTSRSHPEILPAIVLMYADKASSNETVSQSIMLAVDVASLASGAGAVVNAATKLRYAIGILELSSGLTGLSSKALSDAEAGSKMDEWSKKFGTVSTVTGVLSLGMQASIKITTGIKIKDVYKSVDEFTKPVKVENLLTDLENMSSSLKMELAGDDDAFLIMYHYLKKTESVAESKVLKNIIKVRIDDLKGYFELRKSLGPWFENLPLSLKVDLKNNENILNLLNKADDLQREGFIKAWDVLKDFPNVRVVSNNIEVLAKVHKRFQYGEATSFEGLKKLLAEGSPASKQKLIDGLAEVDKAFDTSLPVTFSGIKNGEVKVISVSDGVKSEVARINKNGEFVRKKFLNESDGASVASTYKEYDILKKGDKEVGFRLINPEDMSVKLKNTPDLLKSFSELENVLKLQFVKDFAGASDDVLKKVQKEGLFDTWKNNIRSNNLEELRDFAKKGDVRKEYAEALSKFVDEEVKLMKKFESSQNKFEEVARGMFDLRLKTTTQFKVEKTPKDLLEWIHKFNVSRYGELGGNKWGHTWESIINANQKKGLKGDDLYKKIIASSKTPLGDGDKMKLGDALMNVFKNDTNKVNLELILKKYRLWRY